MRSWIVIGLMVALTAIACASSEADGDTVLADGRLTLESRLTVRVRADGGELIQLTYRGDGTLASSVDQNGETHTVESGSTIDRTPFTVDVVTFAPDALDVVITHEADEDLTVVYREEAGAQFVPGWGSTELVSLGDGTNIELVPEAFDGERFAVTLRSAEREQTVSDLTVGETLQFQGFTIEFTGVSEDGLSLFVTDPAGEPVR